MNGTYEEGEPHQELTVRFVFDVKHSPGNEVQLSNILINYLKPKGIILNDDLIVHVGEPM